MKNKIFRSSNFFAVLIIALLAVSLPCQSVFTQKKQTFSKTKPTITTNSVNDFTADEYEIYRLVNLERQKQRLSNLEWNNDLADLARKYSEKMARENFFSHFDPEGANVARRAKKVKIKGWSEIGENLFTMEDYPKFDAFVVVKWMESPTHERNMLDPKWIETGVGVAQADNGDLYITQVFIKR